jgi:hypothetical protein
MYRTSATIRSHFSCGVKAPISLPVRARMKTAVAPEAYERT